jgi:Extensin-like protein C-terminus
LTRSQRQGVEMAGGTFAGGAGSNVSWSAFKGSFMQTATGSRFPTDLAPISKWSPRYYDYCLKYDCRTVAARRNMTASFLLIAFLLAVSSVGTAGTIPIPRARPEVVQERSPTPETAVAPSPCQLRLAELAVFDPLPPITGPGECKATDVVKVDAVLLPDEHRVTFSPPATLRCPMAIAVAQWISNDVAPTIDTLGTSLRSVESFDSFDCRPRNGITGAQVSEHGRANAIDVRSFKLANGGIIEPNNASVAKSLRERLRDSACARFSTVLGNGADAYHDSHVHVDLMARSNQYKICQWDVLDLAETAALLAKKTVAATNIPAEMRAASDVPLPRPRRVINTDVATLPWHGAPGIPLATYAEEQTVTVGPWTIAVSYKGDRFENCSMNRSTGELGISFFRAEDGLLLVLDSQKWKLERGKVYSVRLIAGSRSVEAKALAELKSIRITLIDRPLNERLRTADVLEVRGEGETLRVPLDGSIAALGRLETCFDKNSRTAVETNPFVIPSRKP